MPSFPRPKRCKRRRSPRCELVIVVWCFSGAWLLVLGAYCMTWLQTTLLLFVALLVVFLQSTIQGFRLVTGAQIDLLPSLIVYAGLNCNLVAIIALAVLDSLLHDSLSANPLGVTMLPLFAVGAFIHYHRGLILKEATFARFILGLWASGAVPVATLLLLTNSERQPLLGWFSLWQLVVMTLL